ncbi:MAG: hypothetical protein ACTS10_04255, partial [Kiloniellales bacterium]
MIEGFQSDADVLAFHGLLDRSYSGNDEGSRTMARDPSRFKTYLLDDFGYDAGADGAAAFA